ncbi:MAG TPA: polysaccharide biosynthesis/export family protein [Deltaproteobacteria bacterium]|jgi:polysaccharide export outer membrane protein|nr:polysaccharide biosynthesis/export family protein [Deltaproteobacteria bacterium]HRW79842.1 polysaccharide biosynthesis/export family protein [Desulfomonilia bacterium]NMD39727.1 sugar ABC transporter substrate-binding protein [Deltaproteobacteria bacterium]HNQ84959.1 polysaccharide biosynthesis/export family protein [Deltaproteobacteria bacterium]HNS88707.1 polysaccharide biosynthesis/export family protein [Deltaproteobacteria bacterium]
MAQEPPYLIGASDLLEISVWGEENLSRQVTVRSDGFISLPLVGDVRTAGRTPSQLKEDLESRLSQYIKDPRCAVIVLEPRSKRYYVQGQVAQPGQFTLDKVLTLTQVIPIAGGFTEWADDDSIVILREEGDKKIRMEVDFSRIIKGKAEDVPIKPGDTIIVP